LKAVIMAGGKGTRLRPLTCNKPKPMVPIANRPMMEHIIYLLRKHGFAEVLVTLFYLPEAVENYFGDGREFGLAMRYFVEEKPLGTAGSVRNAAADLTETFLVISGDALTDIDLTAALRFHRERGATATIILTKVENPLEYGVVITDPRGAIQRFLEKPGWGEVFSDTVNTGIYILEPKIFNYFEPGQEFDFSKNLFPMLLAQGEPLYGYVADGYWSDIGNLEQYRQAHYDVLNDRVKVSIPGREIKPGLWVGEGVEIDPGASVVTPVLIGDYSRVKPGAEIGAYSVLGDYGIIQEGASVKRGILWNHCYLGSYSEVRGATLCHHAYLKGKNAVYEGAVLGEGVELGLKAVVRPEVKVWPNKILDSGSVLNDSLIWAKKSAKSLFGASGISGTVNQEITPEVGAKLGAVFGAYLKPGAQVTVSSDNFRASRVLKRALVSGVLAAGVNVYDLGTMPTPAARYALVALGARGGLHLRIDPRDSEGILIQFMDERGLNVAKSVERALENAFASEDFPRSPAGAMGELTFVPQLVQPYLQGLIGPEAQKLIAASRLKVVASYDQGSLTLLLPALLEELQCKVIHAETEEEGAEIPARPRTLQELLGAISRVGTAVREHQADLGVIVDNNAERLILLDEHGEILKEEQLVALLSLLVLKYHPAAAMPVPMTAPQFIEDLAREYHGRVIRTKVNPRSLMEQLAQERLFPTGQGDGAFLPQFDALFTLVRVLELLARERVSLAGAKALIPQVQRGYAEVDCPWEEKGRIMRNLYEEQKERPLEMTDGLKVYHDGGWALVLPDAEEPIFRIYSEAGTGEEADALTQYYMSRINELQLS
jgi:mannose-1-phosphate guanylyltransferase/phosphomannomutase